MTRITQQNLESYLWGAAVLLRGTIDAGDYKQFIFPLLFFKRLCDVFDEETITALRESGGDQDFALFPENHRFQIPADAHWREIRKVSRDVGRGLQQAMRAIETANPDKLFGIFGDAQWTNKDRLADAMLRDLIEHFSTLELTVANLPEDELGQGYEYLIKKFADDSGHTAAEFYTNRTVVHLMTEMLDVQPGDAVSLQEAEKAYLEKGGSFKALLVSLLSSESFLYRSVPAATVPTATVPITTAPSK